MSNFAECVIRFKLRKREKEMKDLIKKAMQDLSTNG